LLRSVVGSLVKKVRKEVRKKIPAFNPKGMASEAIVEDVPGQEIEPAPPTGHVVSESTEQAKGKPKKRHKKKSASSNRRPEAAAHEETAAWNPSDFQVEEQAGRYRFHDLDLPEGLMHGIHELGFEYCTPIQAAALPEVLDGNDVFGKAQTGTGKTAAFLIAILARLDQKSQDASRPKGAPRALVIGPTRELVMQLHKDAQDLGKYLDVRSAAVYGGIDFEKQQRTIKAGPIDILVATPGRLLDFQRRRVLDLSHVEILVIDEADRMLDMGFIPDVSSIIRSCAPKDHRNTMLFSATLTPQIERLSSQWTSNPVKIEIDPGTIAVDTVDQVVFTITRDQKFPLLVNYIQQQTLSRVLVFSNRRDWVRRLAERLQAQGINATHLSGEVSQDQRIKKLERFRDGKIRVLVATDIAARGIHVDGISHVVNYDMPDNPEDYVHRIGRTGRAGETGTSVSFATEFDAFNLPAVEDFIGRKLPCVYPDDDLLLPLSKPDFMPPARDNRRDRNSGGRPGGDRNGGRGGRR
jgi:ATP-dependent RNA helicase RhlB